MVAVVATVVVGMIVGLGLARSGAKSGAVAATVITLALLFVVHEVANSWAELTAGRNGISFRVGQTLDGNGWIYAVLLVAIVTARLFKGSRVGRLAQAAREDDLAARAQQRNEALVARVNAHLAPVTIDYAADVLPLTPNGNATERHIVAAYIAAVDAQTRADMQDLLLDLAKQLNARVIAEGIEESAQEEQLHAMGCGLGQGYLYSRPVGAEQMRRMLLGTSAIVA